MKWKNYVGIAIPDDFKLVTAKDNTSRMAEWEDGTKALDFSLPVAKDLATGLIANGYPAIVVQSPLELNNPDAKPVMLHSERMELLGQFIDIFEDFLEDKNVFVPNSEKNEIEDGASIIYGTDYDNLSNQIEALLIAWELLEKEHFYEARG